MAYYHLLFSSLPLRKSYQIRLEEFRYRDPSWPARPRPRPARRGDAGGHDRLRPARSVAPSKGQATRRRAQVETASGQPVTHLQRGRPPATSPQGAVARGQPYRLCRGSGDDG
ncbi:hypothetical protein GW17_00028493 [Ensete ventricosum]|nr:hypothetical protein GW17_00028493 [Ensete ventricosum]RZR84964.1 hypothetical protein BHM03_00011875 [Ensete ventricosum]